MRGESDDAKRIYEQVMTLDPENLQANIFLGNYFTFRPSVPETS